MFDITHLCAKSCPNRVHNRNGDKEAIKRPTKHQSIIIQDIVDFVDFSHAEELHLWCRIID